MLPMSPPLGRAELRDRGFTLVETIIVIGMIGLISSVLAAVFTVFIRTQPNSENRADTSRTSLGLTTYLPEDVNSTPPTGFSRPSVRDDLNPSTDTDAAGQGTGCAENTTSGYSLLRLTWSELSDSYVANYRLIEGASGSRIVRYSCKNAGPETAVNLTGTLAAVPATWDPGEAPFKFELVGTNGVRVEVTTPSGEVVNVDSTSNNPAAVLPPVPPIEYPPVPDGNAAPNAPDQDVNTLPTVPVAVATAASDPDGDGLTLTPSSPAVVATTPGWTATLSGLTYTITPPVAAPPGEIGSFVYTVTDPYGQVDTGTIAVTVAAPPPNNEPTASNVTATLTHGTPTVIDLDLAVAPGPYVADADSDPLTIEIKDLSPGLIVTFDNATLTFTVTSTDGLTDAPRSFEYRVDDGSDHSDWAVVTLNVVICRLLSSGPVTPTTATRARQAPQNRLQTSATYIVSYTGPCNTLVLYFDHDEVGAFETLNPQSTATVSGHQEATFEIKGPGGLKDWTAKPSPGHPIQVRNDGVTLTTVRLVTT